MNFEIIKSSVNFLDNTLYYKNTFSNEFDILECLRKR